MPKSDAPVPIITVVEEVSKPVQEAGNDTAGNELGLIEISLIQVKD